MLADVFLRLILLFYYISMAVLLLVLPLLAIWFCWWAYLRYIRADYLSKADWVLLEIKLPKEINRSPAAMEVALSAFYNTPVGNLIEQYIKGRARAYFSLEIASLGGQIHFYVRTISILRNYLEAQIYSQYPEVEIVEVEDYTSRVTYTNDDNQMEFWGMEYKLTKEDSYPIKTYIDYGLDQDPKEEFKIDPLTPVLELLGSISPHEQVWIHIMIRAAVNRPDPKSWFKKRSWVKEAEELIKKIKQGDSKVVEGQPDFGEFKLTKGQRDIIQAIERGTSKFGFDTCIRTCYLGYTYQLAGETKKSFSIGTKIGLINVLKQFGSESMNGFKPSTMVSVEYPWSDWHKFRLNRQKKRMFYYSRLRSCFYPPAKRQPFLLTTEELATLFHFPGQVAATPGIMRVPSKRGEPPIDLPV